MTAQRPPGVPAAWSSKPSQIAQIGQPSTGGGVDEGGIDDLADADLDRVLGRLAEALRGTAADKVIARTVPEGSDVAVTVVGLRSSDDGSASLLGTDSLEDDEVALWLEIPRTV